MLRLPEYLRGLALTVDLRTGCWTIRAAGGRFEVREWTWGERRRLVTSAVVAGGLRRDLFLAGLLELLVKPVPEHEGQLPIAAATLHLLGVPEASSAARPLTELEGLAARTFGWLPDELDRQSAGAIDRLLAPVLSSAATPSSPTARAAEAGGWTRIEFPEPSRTAAASTAPDPTSAADPAVSAEAEARLDRMLAVVARWAGLVPDADSGPQVHPGTQPEPTGVMSPPAERPEFERPTTSGTPARKTVPEIAAEPRTARERLDGRSEAVQGFARLPAALSAAAGSPGPRPAVADPAPWSGRVGRLSPERPVRFATGPEARPAVVRVTGDARRFDAASAARTALGAAVVVRGVSSGEAAPLSRVAPPSGPPQWPTVPARAPLAFGEWSAAGNAGEGESARVPSGRIPDAAPWVSAPANRPAIEAGSSAVTPWLPPGSQEVAGLGVVPSDPFFESALEEQLADVLERAARESGVEVP